MCMYEGPWVGQVSVGVGGEEWGKRGSACVVHRRQRMHLPLTPFPPAFPPHFPPPTAHRDVVVLVWRCGWVPQLAPLVGNAARRQAGAAEGPRVWRLLRMARQQTAG